MMRRTLLQLAGLLAPSFAQAHDTVWLRIRNDSAQPFEQVWLGLPRQGTAVDLGPIAPGQSSRWHAFPAAPPHYRKTRVQLAEHQLGHINDAAYPLGHTALAPGRYTFAYRIEGGALQLRVLKEPPGSAE